MTIDKNLMVIADTPVNDLAPVNTSSGQNVSTEEQAKIDERNK